VPLLIEIKQDLGEVSPVRKLTEVLEGYHGEVLIESFNPKALREFKSYRPDLPRGILSSQFSREEDKKRKILYFVLENMLANCMSRPDFIAYEKDGYRASSLRFVRRVFGTPLFAWTVKSAEEEEIALGRGFDSVIFEGYIPTK
jgi:glycerophosphoryl diester phosphodiesterase